MHVCKSQRQIERYVVSKRPQIDETGTGTLRARDRGIEGERRSRARGTCKIIPPGNLTDDFALLESDTQGLLGDGFDAMQEEDADNLQGLDLEEMFKQTEAAAVDESTLLEPEAEPLDCSLAAYVEQERSMRCPEPKVPLNLMDFVRELASLDSAPAVNPVKQADKREIKRRKVDARPQDCHGMTERAY